MSDVTCVFVNFLQSNVAFVNIIYINVKQCKISSVHSIKKVKGL